MRILTALMVGVATWTMVAGLWKHDWQMIVGSILAAAIWVLLLWEDTENRRHHPEGCVCTRCDRRRRYEATVKPW